MGEAGAVGKAGTVGEAEIADSRSRMGHFFIQDCNSFFLF